MSRPLERFFKKSGKTQVELATFCGVTQATVSRWVSGRVPEDHLESVSGFTNIPASKLRPDLAKLFVAGRGACPVCEERP